MNTKNLSPLILAKDLLVLLDKSNIIVIDASNGKDAKDNYIEKHIKGALFVDLNSQLSDIKEDAANGGRHPLPAIKEFAKTLSSLGITSESHVIIYDDKNGANAAARLWWMLRSIGHEQVQVLNGGFAQAEVNGLPMGSKLEVSAIKDSYNVSDWQLPLVLIETVEQVAKDEHHVIIDVREETRYQGIFEPIDLIAGHIPGAINIPFTSNLDESGLFKSPEQLKALYDVHLGSVGSENVIVHCGSGVTACHTLLAMAYAGIEIPNLYVGSWSEWSRNNKEIGKAIL